MKLSPNSREHFLSSLTETQLPKLKRAQNINIYSKWLVWTNISNK